LKRLHVDLAQVASLSNLELAFARARRGSPHAREVMAWQQNLEAELTCLRSDILLGQLDLGDFRVFHIRDPKPRTIHAPSFRERVLHHAIIALVGQVLDRALVADTFACRVGKGAHAASARVQTHLRRHPWYVQIDIKSYFASIRHDILKALLARRIKGGRVLALLGDLIDAHQDSPGRGLPIGALTSQHFANYYLAGFDRYLLEKIGVRGMVRYMDDTVWWCGDRQQAEASLALATAFLSERLGLQVKPGARSARSQDGLRFCGFHIFPGAMYLSARRRHRYALARRRVESAYALGLIDAKGLQAGYASALAITAHADSRGFRREQLLRVPVRITC
jgi:RNA-directed DNA polymerase